MANRDHSLDSGIIEAAKKEFLEKGYNGASLRKIAEQAGVTIGAIRIRYRTKDDLFQSLVQPFMSAVDITFRQLKDEYFSVEFNEPIAHLKTAMQDETNAMLKLIFEHYEEAVLLLCRSDGSRLESFFEQLVERKITESLLFFRQYHIMGMKENVFRLLIFAQYNSYRQIVSEGFSEETARESMETAMLYHIGGWTALLNSIRDDSL